MRSAFTAILLVFTSGLLSWADEPTIARSNDGRGAPLKIILRQASAIYERPDENAPNRPVEAMQFFYVLSRPNSDDVAPDGFYWICASHDVANDIQGYVPAEHSIRWDHRQAISFISDSARDKVLFFESKEKLVQANTRAGTKPDPISSEPEGLQQGHVLPILSLENFTLDETPVRSYRCAYLHSPQSSVRSGASLDLDKSRVQICIVIDTTVSMQPWLDSCLKVVAGLAERFEQQRDGAVVEFAIVGFRDHLLGQAPADWYVTKKYTDFCDVRQFQTVLSGIKQATVGSEGFPEAGLDGLNLALTDVSWDPNSLRHIVVIGDASWHTSKKRNPNNYSFAGLMAKAQPRGGQQFPTLLHTFRVVGVSLFDRSICEKQFAMLAKGTDPDFEGISFSYSGEGDAKEFIQQLTDFVLSSQQGLTFAQQGQAPPPHTPGFHVILKMLAASSGGANAPAFAEGWCLALDSDGRQCVRDMTLCQKDHLQLYLASLDFIVEALNSTRSGGGKQLRELVDKLRLFSVATHLGEPVNENTPLHEVVGQILSIPVHSDIFRTSLAKLQAMPTEDFDSWIGRLREHRDIMQGHLDQSNVWFPLAPGVPASRHVAFLRSQDLP